MKQLLSVLAVGALVACSEPFRPTVDDVVGDYTARALTITDSTGTRDLLKAGAVFTLLLLPRGATAGYLYLPATAGDSEVVADMAGSWTMSEGVILVSQTADTFVRDLGFFAERGRLYGVKTYGHGARTVRAILTK